MDQFNSSRSPFCVYRSRSHPLKQELSLDVMLGAVCMASLVRSTQNTRCISAVLTCICSQAALSSRCSVSVLLSTLGDPPGMRYFDSKFGTYRFHSRISSVRFSLGMLSGLCERHLCLGCFPFDTRRGVFEVIACKLSCVPRTRSWRMKINRSTASLSGIRTVRPRSEFRRLDLSDKHVGHG